MNVTTLTTESPTRRLAGLRKSPQGVDFPPVDLFAPTQPEAPLPTAAVRRWSRRAGWAGAALLMGCGLAGSLLPTPYALPFRLVNGAYVGGSLGGVVASLGSAAVLGRGSALAEKVGWAGVAVGAVAGAALSVTTPILDHPVHATALPGAMSVMWGSIGVDTAVDSNLRAQGGYRDQMARLESYQARQAPVEVGEIEFEEDAIQVGDFQLPIGSGPDELPPR